MSLDAEDRDLAPLLARLHPYARALLDRAASHALRLHADTVTPDHLLSTLMQDPLCAAHAAVLHAFADPETISDEALAISPGLMVVASGSVLPFSPRAAQALARARQAADETGKGEVSPAGLMAQALAGLDAPARDRLRSAGWTLEAGPTAAGEVAVQAALFRHFSPSAKRALSAANRLAAGQQLTAISPAHLVLGCLKEEDELGRTAGIGFQRARTLLGPETADGTPPRARRIAPDTSLRSFLGGLPVEADSLDLLACFFTGETPELAQILARSKVTAAFLERARRAFQDPPSQAPPRQQDTGSSRR